MSAESASYIAGGTAPVTRSPTSTAARANSVLASTRRLFPIQRTRPDSPPSSVMTGFSGGALAARVDFALHVPYANYGLVEDCHQILMHTFAQLFAKEREGSAPSV